MVRLFELRKFCSNVYLLRPISSKLCKRSPWHISVVFIRLFKNLHIMANCGETQHWNFCQLLSPRVLPEQHTERQTGGETDGQEERNRRGDVICFTPTRRSDVGVSSVASPFSNRSVHFQSGLSTPKIHGLLRIDNEPKRKSFATFKCRLAIRNLIAICSIVEPAELSRWVTRV